MSAELGNFIKKFLAQKVNEHQRDAILPNKKMREWLYNDYPQALTSIMEENEKKCQDLLARLAERIGRPYILKWDVTDGTLDAHIRQLISPSSLKSISADLHFDLKSAARCIQGYHREYVEARTNRTLVKENFVPAMKALENGEKPALTHYPIINYMANNEPQDNGPTFMTGDEVPAELSISSKTSVTIRPFLKTLAEAITRELSGAAITPLYLEAIFQKYSSPSKKGSAIA